MDRVGPKKDINNIYWKCMLTRGYMKVEIIGKGKTSLVLKAWSSKSNMNVAVKIVDKTEVKQHYYEEKLFTELAIWSQIKHPNIVHLIEYVRGSRWTYICMEFSPDGDLERFLADATSLKERIQKIWIFQIAKGLHFLKNIGMTHGDVKPKNILVFGEDLKLCDFGALKPLNEGPVLSGNGTLGYVAPEVLKGRPYDAEKADVWSFGVTALQILTVGTKRVTPIDSCVFKLKKNWASIVPQKARPLIKETISRVASRRRTLDEIMEDEWLNEEDEEIEDDELMSFF